VKRIALGLSLALAMPSMALSRDDTANFVMHGCRDAIFGKSENFMAGYCSGIVITIVLAGNIECAGLQKGIITQGHLGVDPPKGFPIEQALRIVVKYIDARPERMHELFFGLAWDALSEAWPCKH
jgi:hypothetical protein